MGFLRRRPALIVPTAAELAQIGEVTFGGASPYPRGLLMTELDPYVVATLEAAGYPIAGSPEFASLQAKFLEELWCLSETGPTWSIVGAFLVGTNFCPPDAWKDPAFLRLMDAALETLRDDGVAYTALPPFALERWQQVHGFDGIHPAGWPSAIEDVQHRTATPPVEDLGQGESRKLTESGSGPGARAIYAERRADGRVVALIDGVDASDHVHKRWAWEMGPESDSYGDFLDELAERLVTPTTWTHEDIVGRFPCRQRSREELRELAAR